MTTTHAHAARTHTSTHAHTTHTPHAPSRIRSSWSPPLDNDDDSDDEEEEEVAGETGDAAGEALLALERGLATRETGVGFFFLEEAEAEEEFLVSEPDFDSFLLSFFSRSLAIELEDERVRNCMDGEDT